MLRRLRSGLGKRCGSGRGNRPSPAASRRCRGVRSLPANSINTRCGSKAPTSSATGPIQSQGAVPPHAWMRSSPATALRAAVSCWWAEWVSESPTTNTRGRAASVDRGCGDGSAGSGSVVGAVAVVRNGGGVGFHGADDGATADWSAAAGTPTSSDRTNSSPARAMAVNTKMIGERMPVGRTAGLAPSAITRSSHVGAVAHGLEVGDQE